MSVPPPGPPPPPPPYGPDGPYGHPPNPDTPYPGYPPYPGYQPLPAKPPTSGWAIVSLVFGILGGILVSIVTGIVALNKTKDGRQGGRGMAIAGLVLSGVWVLALLGVVALVAITDDGSVRVTSLEPGDCLAELPEAGVEVQNITTVSCDQPHFGEVYKNIVIPGIEFPGYLEMVDYTDQCGPALASVSASAARDDSIEVFTFYPTEQTWKAGDRNVTCIATTQTPVTGSLLR